MHPVTLPPKPAALNPQFCYHSAVKTSVKLSDLANCALNAQFTITACELLAALPVVRRQVKDLVATKKVSANLMEINSNDSGYNSDLEYKRKSDSCPLTVFLNLIKYDSSSPAVAPCLPLCVIYPTFAPGVKPECILDGGAQIVIMRKDVWKHLQVPLVPNGAMPMESTNATTTMTVGVVEDYPIQLSPIKIYLQIQVIKEAPFKVLLSCPFFNVISCSEISTPNSNHEI